MGEFLTPARRPCLSVVALVERALEQGDPLVVPAGVVAQTWRDGTRQVRLARLLGSQVCLVLPLDDFAAREAGQLCGVTGTSDVVDASVVRLARRYGLAVLSSDADDLSRLDSRVEVVRV